MKEKKTFIFAGGMLVDINEIDSLHYKEENIAVAIYLHLKSGVNYHYRYLRPDEDPVEIMREIVLQQIGGEIL